ncbi:hypothetical protein ORJ66_11035 [Pseudoalteromonas tunicata]|uniref:hypothetical protein n=1 Tax=Pseudoalteromonas tunicata TaxID=314281 RepID=UPI00273E7159|nr:hypothetical protein [Pseudoalteromonas tunicata]MDP5213576.1 hypothetical protein [Pseudoalteromonas tunicata]
MKLFKKALLATAVFGAMGAQAATISSTPLKLSAEGVALKVPAIATKLTFDIVVDKDHPSSSTITLNFDSKVDLTANLVGGAVVQGVGNGTAYAGDVGFNYGTGSFTFDDVVIKNGDATKGETDSITFKVNLGNPLTADSAFRIVLGNHQFDANPGVGVNRVLVSGASSLAYVSNKADKSQIETGTGVIAEEVSQFDFKVGTPLNNLIQRDALTRFLNNATTDVLASTFVNDETLGLALQDVAATLTYTGNFKGLTDNAATLNELNVDNLTLVTSGTPATVTSLTAAIASGAGAVKDTTTVTSTFANGTDGINNTVVAIPVTGNVKASLVVTAANQTVGGAAVVLPTGGYSVATGVDAGKWAIDATIINVPYLPVNAANTDTFIHFANETDKEVDVIVTAIDNNGVEYGPMNLGAKLAANTVTKISEPAMDTLFGLKGASTKLSVTFNIDADKGDVNAYAVTQNDKGRTEVSTSQQRGN